MVRIPMISDRSIMSIINALNISSIIFARLQQLKVIFYAQTGVKEITIVSVMVQMIMCEDRVR